MYNGGGYDSHERNISSSGFGEVMGGNVDLSSLARGTEEAIKNVTSYDGIAHISSIEELEVLKSKSKEADDVANSAEESRRQLLAQMEELRRVADEAEKRSREASAKPQKKKGLFKGGQVKKDAVCLIRFGRYVEFLSSRLINFVLSCISQKEIEKLAMDARDKRDALLQVQSQVKDAEALAIATKKEAESLRKEAEDAEMQATVAASMQQQQEHHSAPALHVPSSQNGNGYSFAHNEPGIKPPHIHNTGFGGPPHEFDSNVMAGGGHSIPAPSGYDDPYSNPFG
jgi:hypothetical protein